MLDISKFEKSDVLRVLYDGAKPQGMGFLHFTPEPMTKEEAQLLLNEGSYFDYVKGRVMKVDLSKDVLDPRLYDRDNGIGSAERALSELTKGGEYTNGKSKNRSKTRK